MKKTYNNPTLKVVKIQPAQFIAISGLGKGQEFNGATDEVLSRRGRFSDWEEEEE